MPAIFEVRFSRVFGKDRRDSVYSDRSDDSQKVSGRDAEHAIEKVRRASRAYWVPEIDDEGNEVAGTRRKCRDIVVTSVTFVSDVDLL